MVKLADKVNLGGLGGDPLRIIVNVSVGVACLALITVIAAAFGNFDRAARAEAERLGITPDPDHVGMIDTDGPFIAVFTYDTVAGSGISTHEVDTLADCRALEEQTRVLSRLKVTCLAKGVKRGNP